MATYASIVENVPEYINPINFDLLGKVMGAKQGKFDQNLAQAEQVMTELKVQENLLLRDEDKKIFSEKVKGLVDTVNRSGKMDWSNTGLTKQIKGFVKSAVDDPYIIKQIGNSVKIRNFYSQVDELKKKNDGRYSDINFNDAIKMAGVDKYMNYEIDDVNSPQYQNYVDVTKTTAEKIKQFKELKGDEVIEVRDGAGNIQKRTVKGLTSNEIISYMPNLLSPEEQSQLSINGRHKYSSNPNQAIADLQSYKQKSLANFNKNIETYTKFANNTNVGEQEQKRYAQLKTAEEQAKKMFESGIQGMEENPLQAAGFLEKQSWMSNFATMAGARTSVEYEVDQGFYKARELELAYKKDAREDAKFELEVLKLQQETGQAGIGVGDVSLSRVPDDQAQEVDVYNDVTKDFNGAIGEIKGIVGSVVQSKGIDAETLDLYNTALQDEIQSGTPESVAMKRAFEKAGLSTSHPREYAQLIKTEAKRNKLGDVIAKADSVTQEIFAQNPDKYIKSAERQLNFYESQKGKQNRLGEYLKPLAGVASTANVINPMAGQAIKLAQGIYTIEINPALEEFNTFVKDNGGIGGIKDVLLKDKGKLSRFTSLLSRAQKSTVSVGGEDDLFNDSRKRRNEIVAEQGQGIVTTLDIATVTNEKTRERIVNAIPQTSGQQNFDAKLPLTIIPQSDGNSFVIRQEGGTKISASGNAVTQLPRTYTVTKDDDLFNVLRPSLELQAERREITATNTDYAIKNERINYLDQARTATLQKTAQHIRNTVGTATLASNNPPEYYLTPELTQATLERGLTGKVAPQKIQQLVNLMTNNPNDKFSVEAVPDQGTWTTRVVLKSGGAPILLSEGNTFKSKMDDQLLLYIKQYPQIMIGEAMLNYLKQKPQQVDVLLNRLQ